MNTGVFSPSSFICKTLKNNRAGGFITPRGYRQSKARGLSARRLHDAVLVELISAVHRDNYGVLGVRKMWHALRHDGIDIGRKQTARLMRLADVSGKRQRQITNHYPKSLTCLICAQTWSSVNSKPWPKTNCGWLTLPMCARRKALCTPRLSPTFTLDGSLGGRYQIPCVLQALPLQARNQAIVCAEEIIGLIHHPDHGSQYVSVVYNERLAQHGVAASAETVGDSYHNALAENVNGSYKNGLIYTRRWDGVVEVEIATVEWVSWWNETRLHKSLEYRAQ